MSWKNEIETLTNLIDRQANIYPGVVYLLNPETKREVTFKELQESARLLYGRFRCMGLSAGDRIAFLMDNGLFTARLFLGTMYSGFVSVPLNARAGVSQLAYTLDHSDAKVVFVGSPYHALMNEVLAQVHRPIEVVDADIDSDSDVVELAAFVGPLPTVAAGDAAMLMYTSGSTGQPKGAIHTHKSILAHGRNSVRAHELTAGDRSLLVLPMYHINAECVTLVPTLMSGGSVIVPRGFAVSEFWNWLDDHRCTWSAVVPTIISQLLDWRDPQEGQRAAAFQRIRFLRSSSAPLSPSLHREFLEKFKLPLIQAMGSSEGGNVFSNPAPPGRNKIGSPGLPWGFEARIVDRDGVEVAAGEPGEMLLRGDGMMQGYYKDPAGTAAALDAEGWLHTGDLAYRDEDGYFFVVGRSKELIIKGGVNIAPKQIDEVLEAHPAVLEAAAVGVPDRYVGEDLVAFAVLRNGMSGDESDMLRFCESRLGHFKTPTRIYFVADLPKGPSGKVQRLRLVEEAERRAVAGLGPESPDAGSAVGALPATDLPLELIITDIWKDLLAQSHIDLDSNFFALGGHSLLAIQCVARLRDTTPVRISLSDFFENPTIVQLAAFIRVKFASSSTKQRAGDSQLPVPLLSIPPRNRTQPCPLSPAQERVWFMGQLNSAEPSYNEAEAVRLTGPLSVAILEQAFNAIIERHEILRTTIQDHDGRPTTTVHDRWPLRIKTIDLKQLQPPRRDAALETLVIDEPRRPYSLEDEPGIRVTVVELADDVHVVILMMHHIVCDSSSLGIVWRELAALYDAFLQGRPSPLPPLPIQFGDYAVWQRDPIQQALFEQDLAFWKDKLRGAPMVLDLPADRPRPPVLSFRGNKRQFDIDTKLAGELRQLSRQQRSSLFAIFAAALSTLLYRYTGQDDILIGVPIADRERPELRPLIGFMIDTHVLRTDLSGNPAFEALLGRVQHAVAGVYSHRSAPFDQVVSALQPERNLSYSPIFQVMLNWRDRDDQPRFIGFPGLTSDAILAQSKIAKFDLTLVLTDEGDKISLEAEYSTDLFDDGRIERMIGHFRTLLEGAVENPARNIAELNLLTKEERERLLSEWNTAEVDDVYS